MPGHLFKMMLRRVVADCSRDHRGTPISTVSTTAVLNYISEELSNPVHKIIASLDFLTGHLSPGDEGYEDVESIAKEAANMRRLAKDLYDFAQLQAGSLRVLPLWFDLR